jgi:23S rRNA (cytosine1962-C5)-methyltransferase
MSTVVLHAERDRSLRRHHPWVFSGAIERVEGSPEIGETVTVVDRDRAFLARAAFSPASQIRARVWTFDPDEVVDEAFITDRVRASVERRAPLLRRTDALRLIYAESDGLPGVIADRYGPWVVVELTSAGAERWSEVIVAALAEVAGVRGVYERSDLEVRDREGLERRVGSLAGAEPPGLIEIVEDGRPHLVDIRSGHKTGYYLDQRDNRALVAARAHGRVLDVCAYTGGFSVAAGRHDAKEVVSVDSSGPALALAARNLDLNGLPTSGLVEADAFAELRRRRQAGEQFDVIVLDPPKLANSSRPEQLNRSTRAYKDLNLQAFHLLPPGGTLFTFSCSGAVSADLFQKVVAGAALDAGREARIVGRMMQAPDHPIHLAVPETSYLKGLIVEVG